MAVRVRPRAVVYLRRDPYRDPDRSWNKGEIPGPRYYTRTPFNAELVEVIKRRYRHGDRLWHPKIKAWSFRDDLRDDVDDLLYREFDHDILRARGWAEFLLTGLGYRAKNPFVQSKIFEDEPETEEPEDEAPEDEAPEDEAPRDAKRRELRGELAALRTANNNLTLQINQILGEKQDALNRNDVYRNEIRTLNAELSWKEHELRDLQNKVRSLEGELAMQGSGGRGSNGARETLGLSESAEPEVVAAAYRAMAKKYHPDRGGDTEKMRKINDAYNTLRSDK